MFPPLDALDAAGPLAAKRFTAALAGSVAVHVFALLVIAASVTPGSLTGENRHVAQPLQAWISGPAARDPAPPAPSSSHTESPSAAPVTLEMPPSQASTSDPPASPVEEPAPPFGMRDGGKYYLASELDERPRILSAVDPAYPRVAPPDGGYVVIQLLVSETGVVDRVNIAVADPAGFFEQTVTDAFSDAKLSPGKLNGVAVKSQIWIELKFHSLAPRLDAAMSADEMPR